MTSAEKLFEYLRANKPKAFCDDCLGAILEITPRQQVNARTEAFGLCQEFTREDGPCSHCKDRKRVIAAN